MPARSRRIVGLLVVLGPGLLIGCARAAPRTMAVPAPAPMVQKSMVAKGAAKPPTVTLPEGMRAMAIRHKETDADASVAAGRKVDVMVRPTGAKEPMPEKVVLEEILVLAVDSVPLPPADGPVRRERMVTLAVLPEQAETLVKAMGEGDIFLKSRPVKR